jgi:hypothetical protein
MSLNPVEIEVVGLNIIVSAINGFVNRALLHFPAMGGLPTFKGSEARDLFAVRLLDFLEPVNAGMTGVTGSCVDVLETAISTASFDRGRNAEGLQKSVQRLRTWLEERIVFAIWLPSLNVQPDLALTRRNLLYVAGNTSKHNLSRLTVVAKRLRKILEENGHEVSEEESWLVVDDFAVKFNEDLLVFYCTRITGLLNDVRWGIHDYLLPEYRDSHTLDPSRPPLYSYRYPAGVNSRFARESYWNLMNFVRAEPYIDRFVVPEHMMEHPFRLLEDGDEGDNA